MHEYLNYNILKINQNSNSDSELNLHLLSHSGVIGNCQEAAITEWGINNVNKRT